MAQIAPSSPSMLFKELVMGGLCVQDCGLATHSPKKVKFLLSSQPHFKRSVAQGGLVSYRFLDNVEQSTIAENLTDVLFYNPVPYSELSREIGCHSWSTCPRLPKGRVLPGGGWA